MNGASVTVLDLAEAVLVRTGPLSAMKLQKLVYYCQAWSLVWDERPLFSERIEAWANGPVMPALFQRHKGQYLVHPGSLGGSPDALDDVAQETVAAVLDAYGPMNAQELSDLAHAEDPWRQARAGLDLGVPSEREITWHSLQEYYSSLPPEAAF